MGLIQYNRSRLCLAGILVCFIIGVFLIRSKAISLFELAMNFASCSMSLIESDQFMCESDGKWRERRMFYLKQHERNIFTKNEYEEYFPKNWFPDFQCPNETLIGIGDGGKWACNIEHLKSKPTCLIYSMGSQGDFSFEISARRLLPHCSIHTVDMRLYSCPADVCTFHQARLGDGRNGSKSLRQLMNELNQTNAEIDILKIDIEGGEYSFFPAFFSNNEINRGLQPVYIRQILTEVHLDKTRILETTALFHLLNSQNYVIFHKELNPGYPYYACEYAFLRLNRTFFREHF